MVTDNDIYSTGDVVSTRNNGASGAEYMHIARNRIWNGGTTHWGISWKQCIFEDNVATGVSTTAMGSNYPQYAHTRGEPHVQNIYHSNNSQTQVWGNDREMMTCDGGGAVYYGEIQQQGPSPAERATVKLAVGKHASAAQPGGAICALDGPAASECRRIVSSSGGSSSSSSDDGNLSPSPPSSSLSTTFAGPTSFVVSKPFRAPLTAGTNVTIMPFVGHIVFNGNYYSDGGEVRWPHV
jgi:hypothetical protein